MLGTAPAHQGKGVGSALMQPVLRICDEEGIPAYLESSKKANLAFYRRHGFVERDPLHVPDGGPPIWPMWREPRPPGGRA
jgi:GNAT superfamily N-acetyltransferase